MRETEGLALESVESHAPSLGTFADDLALIREAAAEAGRIAMRYFKNNAQVWTKPGDSPVTEADFAVDRFLRETLLAARPGYGWLSEETVDNPSRLSAKRTFVVDPIDGTRGFIQGSDVWCVSVAVVEAGRAVAGVLDCPVKRIAYHAGFGGGAWKGVERIAIQPARADPVVAGPKPMIRQLPEELQARLTVRGHLPSLAYRLALVAEGVIDATFVKAHSHDWDIAAADLILSEAGGSLLDATGARPHLAGTDPRRGPLVAGHGALLDQLSRVIAAT